MNTMSSLMCISVFRWIVMYDQRYSSSSHTGSTVTLMILFSWTYSLALAVPPILGWGRFTPEVSGQSCAPNWREPEDVPYNVFLFTAGFFLPLTVITVTSLTVARILRRTTRSIVSTEIKAAAVRRQYNVLRMVKSKIYTD